ncbi:hypothetical protein [Marinovum sp.]|uniref:hypothetical protein n=1 Tax=Marinovum sp. TaxID=2024839 RepID=UPI003A949200
MRNVITLTALLLAGAATATSAMTLDTDMNARTIHSFAPAADVSRLTDREILVILNVISSGESNGETRDLVRALTTHVR